MEYAEKVGTMTDKEFVLAVYPNAKFISFKSGMCIEIGHSPYKTIGYCAETTENMTWRYAREDINFAMIRKLEE